MRHKLIGILFLACLGLISPASAQQERSACLRDAQRLCPGLSPGGGRIAACFREHASELSRECKQEIARRRQGSTDDHRRSPDNAIPQEVPTEHRSTYAELDARLDTTRVELRSDQVAGLPKPAHFADLHAANSNVGERLLQSQTADTVRLSLDSL